MVVDRQPNPGVVDDEASFLAFVRALEADRRLAAAIEHQYPQAGNAARGWQNATIEQFLECAIAWAEASEFGRRGSLGNRASPWRRMAEFLHAGKVYE
jgi:hypothetical protein